jgi:uncharacterized protein
MKILVLSDIHYPLTDTNELFSVINKELPDRIILLGDVVQDTSLMPEFLKLLETRSSCRDYVLVRGDSDEVTAAPSIKSLRLNLKGKDFIFIHGHQFNVWSEKFTKKVSNILKKFDRNLPVLAYAVISRIKSQNFEAYLILGHSHALKFFPRLRVACAGCLTLEKNIYNDRGYLVIDDGTDALQLFVNRLGSETDTYRM